MKVTNKFELVQLKSENFADTHLFCSLNERWRSFERNDGEMGLKRGSKVAKFKIIDTLLNLGWGFQISSKFSFFHKKIAKLSLGWGFTYSGL